MSWQFSASFQLGIGQLGVRASVGEGQSRELKAHWAKQKKTGEKEEPQTL